jgi:hypothetical protein
MQSTKENAMRMAFDPGEREMVSALLEVATFYAPTFLDLGMIPEVVILPATDEEYAAFWAERDDWVPDVQSASWATDEGVLL